MFSVLQISRALSKARNNGVCVPRSHRATREVKTKYVTVLNQVNIGSPAHETIYGLYLGYQELFLDLCLYVFNNECGISH